MYKRSFQAQNGLLGCVSFSSGRSVDAPYEFTIVYAARRMGPLGNGSRCGDDGSAHDMCEAVS